MIGGVKLIIGGRCVGGMSSWAVGDNFEGDVKNSWADGDNLGGGDVKSLSGVA